MTLKCRSRFLFAVLAAVLSIAIIFPSARAASTCDNAAENATLRLATLHPTADEGQTASREEMDRIAAETGASDAAREAHPLMLIVAQGGAHFEFVHRVIKGRDTAGEVYFCDVPSSIVILFGAFKRKTIFHDAAAADPCMRQALLEHHRQHNHVLNKAIDALVNKHRDEFARAVSDLTRKTAPSAASAIQNFETGLASVIGALYQKLALEIERSQLLADTPAALDQLRNSCDGKLHQLELEIGRHGKRGSLQ